MRLTVAFITAQFCCFGRRILSKMYETKGGGGLAQLNIFKKREVGGRDL